MKWSVWHGEINVMRDVLAGREMGLRVRCRMKMNFHGFSCFNLLGPNWNPVLPKLCAPIPPEHNRLTRLQRQQGEALVREVYGLDYAIEAHAVDWSGIGALTRAARPEQTGHEESKSSDQEILLRGFHLGFRLASLHRTSRNTSFPLSLR